MTIVKSKYMAGQFPAELQRRFPHRSMVDCRSAREQFAMYMDEPARFREAFCEAWKKKIGDRPQNPKWAADLAQFDAHQHREREPGHWEMLFGKDPGAEAYIVALCGYPLDSVGEVYRPTIIDADANHLHYPSPPWLERTAGGLTVTLGACRAYPSLPEFIHHDVAYKPENLLLFKLHDPNPESSRWQTDRAIHCKKLETRYPAYEQAFKDWQDCTD